VRSQQDE